MQVQTLEKNRLKAIKGHAARLPKEENLHKSVWTYFQKILHRDVIAFHCANGKRRNVIDAMNLKRMGVIPGVPDFCLIFQKYPELERNSRSPVIGFIELKREGHKRKLSEAQEDFKERCERIGVYFGQANSIDGVNYLLKEWGVPNRIAAEVV